MFDQVAGAINGIVDVNNTPEAVETLAVFPAEARAPTIVDDQVGEAAGGPELVGDIERVRHRTRRTPVNINDQRRELARRCSEFGVYRRIEKGVGRYVALGRKFDRLRHRDIGWIDHAFGGAT